MGNDLQTNFGYIIMIDYDSFSHCHLTDIFFAIHVGAEESKNRFVLFLCVTILKRTARKPPTYFGS